SPHDGAWWSHMLWLGWQYPSEAHKRFVARWAPDMNKDRGLRIISQGFLAWHFLFGALVFAAGYALGGSSLGLSWLVWGIFVRLVWVLHSTWFVNSASHMWGYRNY